MESSVGGRIRVNMDIPRSMLKIMFNPVSLTEMKERTRMIVCINGRRNRLA